MGRPKGLVGEKHGMTKTRPYKIWRQMKQRCFVPKRAFFKDYGGRGITVEEKWRKSFTAFWSDMKDSYFDGATLDRIDVNGNYSRENCRWATRKEQMMNRRDNIYLRVGSEVRHIDEWAELKGVNSKTLRSRKFMGWSDEDIVNVPVQIKGLNKTRNGLERSGHTNA